MICGDDYMKRIFAYHILFFTFAFCWAGGKDNVSKLTQTVVNGKKGVFLVDRNYDLEGQRIYFPKALVIKFRGGKLDNGTIVGTKTKLEIDQETCAFGKNIIIQGSWSVKDIYDRWFEFDKKKDFISNQIIKNILSLSNDEEFNHIFFNEDRVYYFKLQTKSAPNIGDILSFHVENLSNGKKRKKRHYSELFGEKFVDHRIFTIPSNTWVTINNIFQMLPTNQGLYFVFWECGKKNVTIDGKGRISGDCINHLYTDPFINNSNYFGEWGYIFRCFKCENFTFKDIELSDSFGDLISYDGYLLEDLTSNRVAKDLLVENVKFVQARRNGMSVSAKDVTITRCLFKNCGIDEVKGTAPCAAIDFENSYVLKYPETGNENVVMENCVFINNKHDVSATNVNVPNYGKTAVTIKNCHFTNPIRLNSTPHWIKFENCTIPSITNSKGAISKSTPIKNVVFQNCRIKSIPALMYSPRWHNKFVNCKIESLVK